MDSPSLPIDWALGQEVLQVGMIHHLGISYVKQNE